MRALAAAIATFVQVRDLELRIAQTTRRIERDLERRYGRCGWCSELLVWVIHDLDCPARMDQRDLMRASEVKR